MGTGYIADDDSYNVSLWEISGDKVEERNFDVGKSV